MIVAIHQPNFAPWLGFFHKMRSADVFVLLDDADFSKNGYINRVRIQGNRWMSVPVRTSLGTPIAEVQLADRRFPESHRGILRAEYGKSPQVEEFIGLERAMAGASDKLVELNLAILDYLRAKLGVTTPLVRSSTLSAGGASTERLVAIVSEMKGDIYLSGSGGRGYQDETLFHEVGIDVRYNDFSSKLARAGEEYSALHALFTRSSSECETVLW